VSAAKAVPRLCLCTAHGAHETNGEDNVFE
jgi:hypothetical protein